jgi:hypothetical protein
VFVAAAGAAMLLVRGETVGEEVVTQALQLWPILVIGLGVGLVLRGTRFRVAGGMLAAAIPGLLLGGLVMAAPHMAVDCGVSTPATFTTQEGTFDGPATVDLSLACGDLSVTTAPGTRWEVTADRTSGPAPTVRASGDRLTVESSDRKYRFGTSWGADSVAVTLPVDGTFDLATEVNAGRGHFDLAGALLGDLRVDVNAGDVRLDLTDATLDRLTMNVNAAAIWVRLPAAGEFTADLDVNAADVDLCAPADLGLRIRQDVVLGATTWSGLVRNDVAWETPGYSTAIHHADVTVSVNVGSVHVNPEGGCK